MKILGPWRRPRHRTALPGSNLSEAAIGVAIRSCPGVQPRRSYRRLHAIIADSASFANSADRFANNFASDNILQGCFGHEIRAFPPPTAAVTPRLRSG